ncbi:MAG: hypothetical protein BM565_00750 [Gammaproteobacteria bacterium MedPE]|nr:MAG: hypothetical protein BM565_00750 [Gammaproteobacteria bacterium MedPE]
MEFKITLDKHDWKKYQSYMEREIPKRMKTWMNSAWVNMIIWMVIAFFFLTVFNQYSKFHWPTAITVSMFFIFVLALFFVNMFKIRRAFEPTETGTFCGNHLFIFNTQGIVSEGDGYQGIHSWSIVKKIERTDGMILIYLDTTYCFVFPESKLKAPDDFYKVISEQYSRAGGMPKNGASI